MDASAATLRPAPTPSRCRAMAPRAGLPCLLQVPRELVPRDALEAVALELAERARAAAPPTDAETLARLLEAAQALPAERAAATLTSALQELLPLDWPRVEAALAAGHPDLAAALAEPFSHLASQRGRCLALADQAAAHHERLARDAGPRAFAAALHRHLAARFGAPPASWPEPAGGWDTARWSCPRSLPPLPPAPPGARLVLSGRCRVLAPASSARTGDATTFDLGAEPARERFDLDVTLTCGRVFERRPATFTALAPPAPGEEGPLSADAPPAHLAPLERELGQAVLRARKVCAVAPPDVCDSLDDAHAADVEERLAAAAVTSGRWPACAAGWLQRRYGVSAPPLPPARATTAPLSPGPHHD